MTPVTFARVFFTLLFNFVRCVAVLLQQGSNFNTTGIVVAWTPSKKLSELEFNVQTCRGTSNESARG